MSNFKKLILLVGDVAILYLALFITLLIRYDFSALPENFETHLIPFSLIFILWLLIFYLTDLYRYSTLRTRVSLLRSLFIAVLLSGTVSAIIFYLFGDFFELTPKTNLLIFSGIFLILDYLWRNIMLKIFTTGALGITVLGDSPLINETIAYLHDNPHTGYRVTAQLKNLDHNNREELSRNIAETNTQLIVIQPHITKDFSAMKLIYRLLPLEIGLINFWDFYEMIFEKVPLDELQESWFIENITTRRPFYDTAKRIVDILLATFASLILLPLTLIAGLMIKLTSKGPVIYKQKRVGKNGRIFTLYKFRTMRHNSGGPFWTEPKDDRLTPFGKFLRFTHLDEIPQLFNIIRGDISFIGPRPERVELVEQYKKFPHYEIRHVIKPGLTGWAQINYRPSASLEEAYEKLRYDIHYIKNRSIFWDFLIILKTIKYVFTSHGK